MCGYRLPGMVAALARDDAEPRTLDRDDPALALDEAHPADTTAKERTPR